MKKKRKLVSQSEGERWSEIPTVAQVYAERWACASPEESKQAEMARSDGEDEQIQEEGVPLTLHTLLQIFKAIVS